LWDQALSKGTASAVLSKVFSDMFRTFYAQSIFVEQADSDSLFLLQTLSTACQKLIEENAAPWRARVGSGRLVAKYGELLADLHRQVMELFVRSSGRSSLIRLRTQTAEQIKAHIYQMGMSIFIQQMQILENSVVAGLKRSLTNDAPAMKPRKGGDDGDGGDSDDVVDKAGTVDDAGRVSRIRLANESWHAFERQANELKWTEGGVFLDKNVFSKVREQLFSIAESFPNTYEGQLASLKKLEADMRRKALLGSASGDKPKRSLKSFISTSKQGRRGSALHAGLDPASMNLTRFQRLKQTLLRPSRLLRNTLTRIPVGAWSVKMGLQLVGMLRPPGYGNLQGYVSYHTGLWNWPLELLFGFHNDGDSPEVNYILPPRLHPVDLVV
jgi:hypothetical protein